MTEEVALVTIHLSDIAETKVQMNELHDRIHALEEEHGITALREELSQLESSYKRQIEEAVGNGLLEEDHFKLINKGRVMTVVTPKVLFERYPDIFWRSVKVTKGKVEDLLLWFYEDQGQSSPVAKQSVKTTIDEISTKSQSGSNYELIDLLSGD